MLNMNDVRLLGYAGRDPEMKEFKDGERVARFTLATTRRWQTKADEAKEAKEAKEATQWHRVAAFGRAAEAAERFVRKGAALLIEGRIEYRSYEGEAGETRYVTEIVVAGPRGLINALGSKPGGVEADAGDEKDTAHG